MPVRLDLLTDHSRRRSDRELHPRRYARGGYCPPGVHDSREGRVGRDSSTIENTASVCAYNTTPACTTDTTYTPVSSLDVFVSAYCQQGAPYLHYDITPHNIDLVAHPLLTLQWAPSVGAVEPWATRTFPSAASISGNILWPGATVDLAGQRDRLAGLDSHRRRLVVQPVRTRCQPDQRTDGSRRCSGSRRRSPRSTRTLTKAGAVALPDTARSTS